LSVRRNSTYACVSSRRNLFAHASATLAVVALIFSVDPPYSMLPERSGLADAALGGVYVSHSRVSWSNAPSSALAVDASSDSSTSRSSSA
jgi:hypothetical protein